MPSRDYFHPHTISADHGNQHSYHNFPYQQVDLFALVSPALSRPASALSNDSSARSALSGDFVVTKVQIMMRKITD